ncbi:MAG: hypothetical protein Q9161_003128 [Pseudevernia consocians]
MTSAYSDVSFICPPDAITEFLNFLATLGRTVNGTLCLLAMAYVKPPTQSKVGNLIHNAKTAQPPDVLPIVISRYRSRLVEDDCISEDGVSTFVTNGYKGKVGIP